MTVHLPRVVPVSAPPAFALPRGRVAELTGGEVRVSGHDLRRQAVVAPEGVRALTTLADGSLLVVGKQQICVLPPGAERADVYPKLSIGVHLGWAWGDPRPRRFWLAEATFLGENELPAQPGEPVLPIGEVDVPRDAFPFVGGRMVELLPGRLMIHAASGKRRMSLPPGPDLVHLVATAGDAAWASDGASLLRLDLSGADATVAARVDAGGTVVAIDAHQGQVAALVAEGDRPRWSVRLHDAEGRERWRAETPFQPDVAHQGLLAVAIGRFDPVVAAGDGQRLALFTANTGELVSGRR